MKRKSAKGVMTNKMAKYAAKHLNEAWRKSKKIIREKKAREKAQNLGINQETSARGLPNDVLATLMRVTASSMVDLAWRLIDKSRNPNDEWEFHAEGLGDAARILEGWADRVESYAPNKPGTRGKREDSPIG